MNQNFKTALKQFDQISSSHLRTALIHRFNAERISKYFTTKDYSFESAVLPLTNDDAVLIEFQNLQTDFPDVYESKYYRLLLILSLSSVENYSQELVLELNDIRRQDNIDRIVIWSSSGVTPETLQFLKGSAVDVVSSKGMDLKKINSISHYIPVNGKDHGYELSLNLAADILLKRLKKMFHLVLSEVAAPIYDLLYSKQKIATEEIMQFEDKLVRGAISVNLPNADQKRVAIDVGCGTGRHTFELAKQFKKVYAFDFSPLMIETANAKQKRKDIRNVLLSTADLEYETIRDEPHFNINGEGQVDLIVASFGMGSFIEDTAGMLRRYHSWLSEDGIVILSFYNAKSIVNEITPNWRDTSLAAHLDVESKTLRVALGPKTVFHIFCKPYDTAIEQAIGKVFEIVQHTTYPTLMALMPNGLLETPKARTLFRHVDTHLAESDEHQFGHYVTIVAKKKSISPSEGHNRVLKILSEIGLKYEIISHPPVVSTDKVKTYLNIGKNDLAVKTILLQDRDQGGKGRVAVVLPANFRADPKEVAQLVGARRLALCSDLDVLNSGFPLGGVAPFGFLRDSIKQIVVDERLISSDAEWVFTGSGDNSKTLKMLRSDFLKIFESENEKIRNQGSRED